LEKVAVEANNQKIIELEEQIEILKNQKEIEKQQNDTNNSSNSPDNATNIQKVIQDEIEKIQSSITALKVATEDEIIDNLYNSMGLHDTSVVINLILMNLCNSILKNLKDLKEKYFIQKTQLTIEFLKNYMLITSRNQKR